MKKVNESAAAKSKESAAKSKESAAKRNEKANIAKAQQATLAKEKEAAINEALKVNDNDVANAINEGNVFNALASFNTLSKGRSHTSSLYNEAAYGSLSKDDKKKLRMELRKKRNAFAKDIIASHAKKDIITLNALIKSFKGFYKTFYKVNDLSFHSLSAKNNDEDTFILISAMLKVIKEHKVK